ncbi:hypothetical protein FB470_001574 [Amycolatopsis thermophila]|uniref:Uncharacterized protein n=1 Tax=Amycolatopsis thermophila TaxID=206084 RepID=A0ABU0EQL5_9PSEU|nr:hypothetical protein [Amycolatopsis thermophila]
MRRGGTLAGASGTLTGVPGASGAPGTPGASAASGTPTVPGARPSGTPAVPGARPSGTPAVPGARPSGTPAVPGARPSGTPGAAGPAGTTGPGGVVPGRLVGLLAWSLLHHPPMMPAAPWSSQHGPRNPAPATPAKTTRYDGRRFYRRPLVLHVSTA